LAELERRADMVTVGGHEAEVDEAGGVRRVTYGGWECYFHLAVTGTPSTMVGSLFNNLMKLLFTLP
jgi:hypothetical protein